MFIDFCFPPEDNFKTQFFVPRKSRILKILDSSRKNSLCPLCIQSDSTLIRCGIDTGHKRLC